MTIKKKMFSALPLLLMGVAANASGASITIPDFTIDKGAQTTVSLSLESDQVQPFAFSGLQFDLFLPDGLSMKNCSLSTQLDGAGFSLSVTDYGQGACRIIAFTDGKGAASADLMNLTFRASNDVKRGEAVIRMQDVIFSAPDGQDIDLTDSEATVFFNTYGEAPTPLQLLRKGDGRSCTFICMMPVSNEQIASDGYRFVYGYDTAQGSSELLEDTPLRYCHTEEEIFNNSSLDFWVFAYYTDSEGTLCVSDRRHLDGSVDDDFDPEAFIGNTRAASEEVSSVFSLEGNYMGKDVSGLAKGIYVVKTAGKTIKILK